MKKTDRKRYNSQFIAQAVELVSLGRPVPQVAQELGIGTSILYRWTQVQRQAQQQPAAPAQFGGAAPRAGGEGGEGAELRRLRHEVAHLRMENDILKKAAVILGTQPLHSRSAP